MSGYIAIMADSCTVLRSFGPITLGCDPCLLLEILALTKISDVFELLECDHYRHAFMY